MWLANSIPVLQRSIDVAVEVVDRSQEVDVVVIARESQCAAQPVFGFRVVSLLECNTCEFDHETRIMWLQTQSGFKSHVSGVPALQPGKCNPVLKISVSRNAQLRTQIRDLLPALLLKQFLQSGHPGVLRQNGLRPCCGVAQQDGPTEECGQGAGDCGTANSVQLPVACHSFSKPAASTFISLRCAGSLIRTTLCSRSIPATT